MYLCADRFSCSVHRLRGAARTRNARRSVFWFVRLRGTRARKAFFSRLGHKRVDARARSRSWQTRRKIVGAANAVAFGRSDSPRGAVRVCRAWLLGAVEAVVARLALDRRRPIGVRVIARSSSHGVLRSQRAVRSRILASYRRSGTRRAAETWRTNDA